MGQDKQPEAHRVGRVRLKQSKGTGVWQAHWRDGGRKRQHNTECMSVTGATRVARQINDELEHKGEFVSESSITVAQALVRFEKEYDQWRPITWSSYRYFFSARLLPQLGTTQLRSLTTPRLQDWLDEQEPLKDPDQELSASAYNTMVTCLAALFGWCYKKKLIRTNPAGPRCLQRQREPDYMDVEARALTEQQTAQLLAQLAGNEDSPHAHLIAMVAVDTGLRRGELMSLTWEKVDFEGNRILVNDSWDGKGTKTGRERHVPMTSRVREALRERAALALSNQRDLPPLPHINIQRSLKTAGKAAGIGHVHFHMLRHTAATRWCESGLKLEEVQRLLGHAKIEMTRRYMTTRDDIIAKKFKVFDEQITSV